MCAQTQNYLLPINLFVGFFPYQTKLEFKFLLNSQLYIFIFNGNN